MDNVPSGVKYYAKWRKDGQLVHCSDFAFLLFPPERDPDKKANRNFAPRVSWNRAGTHINARRCGSTERYTHKDRETDRQTAEQQHGGSPYGIH